MSSRTMAAVLLAVLALSGRPAAGQEVQARRARYESLVRAWRSAAEQERLADSIRSAGVSLGSTRVGPFVMVTAPGWGARAEPAVIEALEPLRQAMGGDLTPLDGTRLLLRPFGDAYPAVWLRAGVNDPLAAVVRVDSAGIDRELSQALLAHTRRVLALRSGKAFSRWTAMLIPLPADPSPDLGLDRLLEGAGITLATAPQAVVRRCYAGDLTACLQGHGLVAVVDTVRELYDAEDRRRVVRGMRARGQVPDARDCVELGNDSACIAFLRRTGALQQPPLPLSARRSLLALALELGGPGALRRLLADTTAPVGDRLAAAAGVPRDSLLAAWRVRALASRPPAVAGTGRLRWTALFWVTLFSFLAVRSTRWRFR